MKEIKLGNNIISNESSPFFIAEIGNNHQGKLENAIKMIKIAAFYGANCVKFQKRNNKEIFTEAYYNRPYDNENSFGKTYGEHREFLEFGIDEFKELMKCAKENEIEFMSTAFDFSSVDFLEKLNVKSYKFASGELTNIPLLVYAAKIGKPMFISTGAASLDEVKIAFEEVIKYNDQICLLHCTAGYPTEYENLNLNIIDTLKKEFPEAIIGFSGHDNGILASVIAYMHGARVFEKHFTLNRSWKGTDHKFSLEPEGLRKQIRDLHRIQLSIGDSSKIIREFEKEARKKMGKSIYASHNLEEGITIKENDICIKSPGMGLAPYYLNKIIGKKLKKQIKFEEVILLEDVE